ncbi:HEAT repeat domain-containing protein [candidate division KSB1 bacterium]|nr:HEAT repeat domain-containing protein [candidate division KSB1 bacterium]
MVNKSRKSRLILNVTLVMMSFIGKSYSQEKPELPEFMTLIETNSGKLQDKILAAQKRFRSESQENKFWMGYRFQPRTDIEFDRFYVHDDNIIISRGHGDFYLQEEDDLKAHVLHALSELGDEKAEKAYEVMKKEFAKHSWTNWGLFFLLDGQNSEIRKIKLTHLYRKSRFDDFPVYWFGEINNNESFNYLTGLIKNDGYQKKVVKPAMFVLSLHEHPKVISYLTQTAAANKTFDIRKSAVFWLGQIPEEESFAALVQLFEKEKNLKMKEKLVFSISQHKSEKVVAELSRIAKNDDDFRVQEKAVFWLGQIDREETLDVLTEMLKNTQHRKLKEKIVFAISQHKSERAVPILIDVAENDKNREVRKKAIFWLGQMAGRKTLEALGDIVENEDETDLKTKAVFAISQHQDKEQAVDMLMDIARSNPNPKVRKKAIFWLGQTGDERAVAFFKDILTR